MAAEIVLAYVHRVCSWCGAEFAREQWAHDGAPEITTWGICKGCLDEEWSRMTDTVPARAPGDVCGGRGGRGSPG